jgi:polyisoprenoid-binding protein YceI
MNKSIVAICLVLAFVAQSFTGTSVSYKVDTKASKVNWVGKKLTGLHSGTVAVKEGVLIVSDGKFESGKFDIDMSSIVVEDIKDANQNKSLVEHLKNEDFFSVDKHPTAVLVITRTTPNRAKSDAEPNYICFGNLNIKGINQPITFPARVNVVGDKIDGTANIRIDRTKWDIKYKSGTIFPELADKAINDEIEFNITLAAAK